MATADINGFPMHYEESGSGDPVILHHGFISRSDIWTPLIERLGANRRYIRFDCRGAGASGAPTDGYTMRNFALDTIALADHLGLDRFSFIGHSMGGDTGFQLGLNHADRLDKLLLLAPAPADAGSFLAALEGGEVEPSLMVTLGALIPAALDRDRDRIAQIARYLYLREPDPSVYSRFVEGVAEAGEGHIGFFGDLATNAALDGDLATLNTPTAMLVGDQDSLAPTNVADFQRLPNATLHVFSGTGHMFFHEVPDAAVAVIDDFLRSGVRRPDPLPESLQAVAT
jgi:non-heme chloroperoxidase